MTKQISKYLLISGSPRAGNSEYLLNEICNRLPDKKELILLREKNIQYCQGCLYCHYKPECKIKDDMTEIRKKLQDADKIILASPNYFDNVSGLMKNFIDRCHPFYTFNTIKDKKLYLLFVGGGQAEGTKKELLHSFQGFIKYLGLKLCGTYSFEALNINDLKGGDYADSKQIQEIVDDILKNKS